MIKRFDLVPVSYDSIMQESPEGEYVLCSDAAAETAKLRALLVRACESLYWMADRGPDTDRDGALLVEIDAALAETEGAT